MDIKIYQKILQLTKCFNVKYFILKEKDYLYGLTEEKSLKSI